MQELDVLNNVKETVFWMQHGRCTQELTFVLITCTRNAQAQASHNSSMEGEKPTPG